VRRRPKHASASTETSQFFNERHFYPAPGSHLTDANQPGARSSSREKDMKNPTVIAAACACLCILPGIASAQTQAASTTAANPLAQADKDFVQAASMSSSTEIDAGKLAVSNSSDKDVKSFARHMMIDHTKLTLELKMAAPHGVEVPKDNSDLEVLNSLKPLKAKSFDQAYIHKVGLEGHQKTIAAFEKEISDGQNADLKKAAQKGLPTIKEHYQMAQDLAAKKGVAQ
jgi:predicted outer membrane protein